LTPGQQEYIMPADLTELVNISERQTASQRWNTIEPTDLRDAMDNTQSVLGWDGCNYGSSRFKFYGPYLSAAVAQGPAAGQIQKITVEPAIDVIRMVELAYTAKWLPIVNATSLIMLPDEGTYAMQCFAIAEINRSNNDTLSAEYEAKGQKHLTAFLTWVRQRQTVERPRIAAYLED
jgi:hypothetical protein